MDISVKGIKIFYERYEGEGEPILLLHGWGGSGISVKGLFNYFVKLNRSVISLDFPGFGLSDFPPKNFGIFDYAQLVLEFLAALKIPKVSVIGHSFGGRVAIILASGTSVVEKLVLVDAAGLKPRRSLKYYLKVFSYKVKKKLGVSVMYSGSSDYRALDERLKPVFTRVVNTHLDAISKNISCETLIVWGGQDKETPLYFAKRLERNIANSGLVVFKNAGHFSYVDEFSGFCAVMNSFFNIERAPNGR